MVLLSIQSATRDPRIFPQPDEVIIDRSPNRHIAFGASEHRCLGSHLARAELRHGHRAVAPVIPEYGVDTDEPLLAHGGQIVAARAAARWPGRDPSMKPAPFEYHAAGNASTRRSALLAELGDDAKVLAGGQSLVPMLALRLARFDHLVDVGRIAELRGIERRERRRSTVGAGDASTSPSSTTPTSPRRCRCWRRRRRTSVTSRSATVARSAARSPTPTRRPSTRPWPSPSTPSSRRLGQRGRVGSPPPSSSPAFWTTVARARRAADGRPLPGLERAAAGSASPSSPAGTATSPSPARSPASQLDDDRRDRAQRARRCSASAPRRSGRVGAEAALVGHTGRRRRRRRGRRAGRRPTSTTSTDDLQVPAGYRTPGRPRRWSPTPGAVPAQALGRSTHDDVTDRRADASTARPARRSSSRARRSPTSSARTAG